MKIVYNVGSNTRLYILSMIAGHFVGIFASTFRWGISDTTKYTDVEFQINNESVLDGMEANKISLSEGCSIVGMC